MRLALLLTILPVLAAWPPSPARAAAPASQPAEAADARLAGLVAQLNAKAYVARESASRELAKCPFSEVERLAPLFKSASAPEQRIRLKSIVQQIYLAAQETERRVGGFLGITHVQCGPAVGGAVDDPNGVRVETVLANSPAQQAGVRVGDLVVALNGQPVTKLEDGGFVAQIQRFPPGEKVKLAVLRDDKKVELTATLASRARFGLSDPNQEWANQFNQFWRDKFDPDDKASSLDQPGVLIIRGPAVIQLGPGNLGPGNQ